MSGHKDPADRLVDAYDAMLERVHLAAETAEKRTIPWLRDALEDAREKAVELNELTREEADKVSQYIERDLHEAADFVAETGQELKDWLRYDMALIQDQMLNMFSNMVDHTSEALKNFADQAHQASIYRTGEVASPGVLKCSECGEELHFKKTGRIPPCPKCHATQFQRIPRAEDEEV